MFMMAAKQFLNVLGVELVRIEEGPGYQDWIIRAPETGKTDKLRRLSAEGEPLRFR